jgi:hypothetical protein
MILARNSELLTEARYSATPKLVATAFEAVQLIKPPAPRGVSDSFWSLVGLPSAKWRELVAMSG